MLRVREIATPVKRRGTATWLIHNSFFCMGEHVNHAQGHDSEDFELAREMFTRLGDRWTAVLLAVLGDRCMRFKDLHRSIDGISQRMLVVTLRHLERDGLMTRMIYPSVPPRVDYEISERGRSLKETLGPIATWAAANRQNIEESRRRFDMSVRKPGASAPVK
jgi:DNA-binding HxlR family transcriptional regulator